jgi:hypothetical protein
MSNIATLVTAEILASMARDNGITAFRLSQAQQSALESAVATMMTTLITDIASPVNSDVPTISTDYLNKIPGYLGTGGVDNSLTNIFVTADTYGYPTSKEV